MSELDPAKHYKTTENLTKRAEFNAQYGTFSWFDWVADHVPAPLGVTLDIGCGPGWFWHRLAGRWRPEKLVLADLSPAMVSAARERLTSSYTLETCVADVTALPFPDQCFETVFAMHMLYHCPDPSFGLHEIARVLKPGGQAVITTICDDDLSEMADLSRVSFGSSGTDLILPVFGATQAARLLPAHFATVENVPCIDHYDVDDSDAALAYITSFPPGKTAPQTARLSFRQRFEDRRIAQGGSVRMARKQMLFRCHKA